MENINIEESCSAELEETTVVKEEFFVQEPQNVQFIDEVLCIILYLCYINVSFIV